jgi:hypothetical protein
MEKGSNPFPEGQPILDMQQIIQQAEMENDAQDLSRITNTH